jgi:hypothetical protein
MVRSAALVVGSLLALIVHATPAAAQVRVDVGIRTPNIGARVIVGQPRVVVVDRVYEDRRYRRERDDDWRDDDDRWRGDRRRSKRDREYDKDLREARREYEKERREAEREYLKEIREAEREYEKDLYEARRDRRW